MLALNEAAQTGARRDGRVKWSTRDAYLQRLSARKLIVSDGRGQVRAAEEVFG
jgi:hypothetical protein